jgi:hypothetical protein
VRRADDDFKLVGNGHFELTDPERVAKEYAEYLPKAAEE